MNENDSGNLVLNLLGHPDIPNDVKGNIATVIRFQFINYETILTDTQTIWFRKLIKQYEQRKQSQIIREKI